MKKSKQYSMWQNRWAAWCSVEVTTPANWPNFSSIQRPPHIRWPHTAGLRSAATSNSLQKIRTYIRKVSGLIQLLCYYFSGRCCLLEYIFLSVDQYSDRINIKVMRNFSVLQTNKLSPLLRFFLSLPKFIIF